MAALETRPYQTSTETTAGSAQEAWKIDFSSGSPYLSNKNQASAVLCIRTF